MLPPLSQRVLSRYMALPCNAIPKALPSFMVSKHSTSGRRPLFNDQLAMNNEQFEIALPFQSLK